MVWWVAVQQVGAHVPRLLGEGRHPRELIGRVSVSRLLDQPRVGERRLHLGVPGQQPHRSPVGQRGTLHGS
jgi:hypothetical protein